MYTNNNRHALSEIENWERDCQLSLSWMWISHGKKVVKWRYQIYYFFALRQLNFCFRKWMKKKSEIIIGIAWQSVTHPTKSDFITETICCAKECFKLNLFFYLFCFYWFFFSLLCLFSHSACAQFSSSQFNYTFIHRLLYSMNGWQQILHCCLSWLIFNDHHVLSIICTSHETKKNRFNVNWCSFFAIVKTDEKLLNIFVGIAY